MFNKIIISIITLICVSSSIYTFHKKTEIDNYAKKILNAYNVTKFIEQDYWLTINHDSSHRIDGNIFIRDKNDNILSAADAIGDGKKLIVRYSELNCNSCVDSLLHYTSIFAKEVGENNVMVWASYSSIRDFHLLFRLNKAKLNICNIESQISEYDQINNPYVFVLDEDLTIRRLFFPHKELPDNTKRYFDTIKSEFL